MLNKITQAERIVYETLTHMFLAATMVALERFLNARVFLLSLDVRCFSKTFQLHYFIYISMKHIQIFFTCFPPIYCWANSEC